MLVIKGYCRKKGGNKTRLNPYILDKAHEHLDCLHAEHLGGST